MASPQTDDGFVRIANELFDALLSSDLGKREQKVVLAVIRKTYGYQKKEDVISTHQIAQMTGLDRSHVARCLRGLVNNGVILSRPSGISRHGIDVPYLRVNKDYSQWQTGAKTASVHTGQTEAESAPVAEGGTGAESAPVGGDATDAETAPVETAGTGAKTARVPNQHGCQISTGNGCQIGHRMGAKSAPSKDNPKDRKDSKEQRARGRARSSKDDVAHSIAEREIPEWLDREAWRSFVWYRRERRKDMTERAAELAIKHLGEYREQGNDPKTVLEQSIANGWTGLFPVKSASGSPRSDDNAASMDRWLQRQQGHSKVVGEQ